MNNTRLILWLAVGFVWLMVYQTYVAWKAPVVPQTMTTVEASAQDVPTLITSDDTVPGMSATSENVAEQVFSKALASAGRITVKTDVLEAHIDLKGGDIRYLALLNYPVKKNEPNNPVVLFDDRTKHDLYVAQDGWISAAGPEAPTHHSTYQAKQTTYELKDGQTALPVRLLFVTPDGLTGSKTLTFYKDSYKIDVATTIENKSAQTWQGARYQQIQRANHKKSRGFSDVESYSFVGPIMYDGKHYDRYKIKEVSKENIEKTVTENGFIASIQYHFLAALLPGGEYPQQFALKSTPDQRLLLSSVGPSFTLNPGESRAQTYTLFAGPKLQSQLNAIHPKLKLAVDYGWLSMLSQPLFWALNKIHGFVQNWGWSIVILTLLIKLCFYKLTETSYRSMAKMKKLTPRMQALQERFKDDKPKLSRSIMEMYKKEGVNPAAGCLPLLVQMPVFLAFYWMLIESVELRQAPFIFWINDLSTPDPFFILPALNAVAMIVQHKLNPKPADPVQAKVFAFIPYIFAVMFAFFPAGLVLYWLVNSIVSVSQQQFINYRLGVKNS